MNFYLRSVTSDVPLGEYLRMVFDEGKHDRAPKGSTGGGQFVSKGSGGGKQSSTQSGRRPTPRRPVKKAAKKSASSGPKATEKATAANKYTPHFDGFLQRGVGRSGPGDDRVRKIQRDLNRLGIRGSDGKPLAVDGRFGPETERAVKAAQRKLGMEATGKVDFDQMQKFSSTKSLSKSGGKQKMCPCRSGECLGGDSAEFRCAGEPVGEPVDEPTEERAADPGELEADDEREPETVLAGEVRALILSAARITTY